MTHQKVEHGNEPDYMEQDTPNDESYHSPYYESLPPQHPQQFTRKWLVMENRVFHYEDVPSKVAPIIHSPTPVRSPKPVEVEDEEKMSLESVDKEEEDGSENKSEGQEEEQPNEEHSEEEKPVTEDPDPDPVPDESAATDPMAMTKSSLETVYLDQKPPTEVPQYPEETAKLESLSGGAEMPSATELELETKEPPDLDPPMEMLEYPQAKDKSDTSCNCIIS